jgi:hypothetical protein
VGLVSNEGVESIQHEQPRKQQTNLGTRIVIMMRSPLLAHDQEGVSRVDEDVTLEKLVTFTIASAGFATSFGMSENTVVGGSSSIKLWWSKRWL